MKKTILSLFIASVCFVACTKSDNVLTPVSEPCVSQIANPSGKTYTNDSVVAYTCTSKHCGMLPLSVRNYWIYEDSTFNDGVFVKVQMDTLRFKTMKKSLSDDLVWWESNLSIGLPEIIYSNDSTLFALSNRLFIPGFMDVKKEYGLFNGDSARYLTSFSDVAATGRSLRVNDPIVTPAGTFSNCLYFEKNARYYRKDQVFFRPNIGVIRYVMERAPMGSHTLQLQQVSTLIAVHLE